MYRHILLPTDGSALSKKAVKAGIALASKLGARVTGFYSPEQYEVLSYGEYFPPELVSRAQWEKQSKRITERILGHAAKEAARRRVRYDQYALPSLAPWQAIVEAARRKKCDLIFMASHGRTGIAGVLLGSQAAKVLAHSRVPVLVHK
ncbi:MAG TPA: universal stress protein [Burkholderiales bacterium]|jgi:nucleotide-binding universal stress UspA family protein|nr:universal stress protein [Burkholderiales bacterium]